MNELVGRKCKVHININSKDLFYTATILQFNSDFVIFSDKHGDIYMYKTSCVVEINDKISEEL